MRFNLLVTSLFFLFLCLPEQAVSQQKSAEIKQIQPIIMVIPFAKEDENLRTVLEENIETRVAVTKVKEGFDDRGYTTVDFVAKLKATEFDEVFTSTNQTDVKSQLAAYSGADIYVEVEAFKSSSPSGNSARVILTAFDTYTGRSLGSKTGASNTMRTEMFDKLVEQALRKKEKDAQIEMVADFLNVMQEKFTDMIENGRPIKIMFTLDNNVDYTFDSENAEGDLLSEVIDDWISDNAYKNNYNDGPSLSNRITFSEVRIPLRDENGKNYTPKKFGRKIRKHFRGMEVDDTDGISPKVESRGGTLYVTFE